MEETDRPERVDQHVASLLESVSDRPHRQAAMAELSQICQPRRAAPEVPSPGTPHRVGLIQRAPVIGDHGPRGGGLRGVRPRRLVRLERNHQYTDLECAEGRLRLLQLQQVSSTGESAQVAVKDEQQPAAAVVLERVRAPFCVPQPEGHGWPADSGPNRQSSIAWYVIVTRS